MTRPADSEATLEFRRDRHGAMRVFVDGRLVAGVKAITIDCVGFANAAFNLKLSGKSVRLTDEEPVPTRESPAD